MAESYCDAVPGHEWHGPYHDREYGFPLEDDAALFERLVELRKTHGSFAGWLAAHHPRPRDEWIKLFKKTFRFTGGEIVNEFLMSIGYLPGAHLPQCPVHQRILKRRPPWSQ